MEGPSLKIAVEQLSPFKGKAVIKSEGNTKQPKEQLLGQKVVDIYSWGKHLIFQFEEYALKTHFLLWGSYKAEIDGKNATGEYYRERNKWNPRLRLEFKNGNMDFYNCSVRLFEDQNYRKNYDFSVDILEKEWDPIKAFASVKEKQNEEIADVLLDQEIFSGSGNIIKNEVLYRTGVLPERLIKDLSDEKLREIITDVRTYAGLFYKWRKKFELKKHYQVYRQKECPNSDKIVRKKTGKRNRISFYCLVCQK